MNWRNPFLTSYLAVTVVGAGILGFLVYSSYSHYTEVSTQYDTQVARLQSLQNRVPFPNAENNATFSKLTGEYRAEYDRLLAQVAKMQKPIDTALTPQAFQDRLRAYVSAVEAAAKQNDVKLPDNFYLGFDQYQGNLPSNEAAGPLARELDAVRLIVDRLVEIKVTEIAGIRRDLLPEEGGAAPKATPAPAAPAGRRTAAPEVPKVVSSNSFDIAFVADQSRTKSALNAIATANQFFIIRNLTIENSHLEGPKRVEDAPTEQAAATPPPASADVLGSLMETPSGGEGTEGAVAGPKMRLLVGRESLRVAARIEMITFTPPSTAKK